MFVLHLNIRWGRKITHGRPYILHEIAISISVTRDGEIVSP